MQVTFWFLRAFHFLVYVYMSSKQCLIFAYRSLFEFFIQITFSFLHTGRFWIYAYRPLFDFLHWKTLCETKHKLAGGICEAKIQFCFLFVCSLFCLLVEPFTPIGHPAFFMGAGLPICVLFVLEPFTPIGHKAFFMGAGLPLVYFVCVFRCCWWGPMGREPVSPSRAANCLEVSGHRPEPKQRRVSEIVDFYVFLNLAGSPVGVGLAFLL